MLIAHGSFLMYSTNVQLFLKEGTNLSDANFKGTQNFLLFIGGWSS